MKKTKSPVKQAGISAITLLILTLCIVSALILVVKITPSYMEYFTLESVMDSFAKDYSGKNISQSDLRQSLRKRLHVNNIQSVKDIDIRISDESKKTRISIDYDVKRHLIGNIALVMNFSKTAEVQH